MAKYTETLTAIGERPEEGNGGQLRALVLANRATAQLKVRLLCWRLCRCLRSLTRSLILRSQLDKYDDAFSDIEASLALYPDYYKSLRTRARIRLAKEEYTEAIEDFKLALDSSMVEATAAEQKAIEKEIKLAEVQLKRSQGKDYYKILKYVPFNTSHLSS